MAKVVVVDGQGGGVGRMLVEKLKARQVRVIAVGTNALATSAMLKAGADAGATGENAVRVNCRDADVLLGPSGIGVPDAMLGEVSPAMAEAVLGCPGLRLLLEMDRCGSRAAGRAGGSMEAAAEALAERAAACVAELDGK